MSRGPGEWQRLLLGCLERLPFFALAEGAARSISWSFGVAGAAWAGVGWCGSAGMVAVRGQLSLGTRR
jgi:hypothetical protein